MMRIFRYLLVLLILLPLPFALSAQDNAVMAKIRAGHNASFGPYAAFSVETIQTLFDNFMINGGVQYSSIGRTALEARPAWFRDYGWGRLSAEALLSYSRLTSVNNVAFGAGADISGKWIGIKLGYYYRLFGHKGNSITEPFNIYYELRANLLPMKRNWDLELAITNNEIFELERHYQPSFIATCMYYPRPYLGLSMGIGCKPSGMFHLSADYYQSFVNLGVCYRW